MADTIGRYQTDDHVTQGVAPSPQPPAPSARSSW